VIALEQGPRRIDSESPVVLNEHLEVVFWLEKVASIGLTVRLKIAEAVGGSMRKRIPSAIIVLVVLGTADVRIGRAKEKAIDPNDPTLRLYSLLDTTREGKMPDLFLLADTYSEQGKEFQRVLRAEYDKNRAFGKLRIYVRSVAKMAPEQLQSYTAKQVYDFGETDLEKFVKTDPGEFGKQGDIYLRGDAESPLTTAPITDETRKSYETLVVQYLLPALQKK
jgi:hypothetical protein